MNKQFKMQNVRMQKVWIETPHNGCKRNLRQKYEKVLAVHSEEGKINSQ